jgi:hypothetical protein
MNGVPLSYILREHDAPVAAGTVFSSVHERLVLETPLSGHAYAEDNGKVWELLLQLVLDGPGWAYALPYEKKRDGRGAFKAMKAHYYMGSSALGRTKKEAYATLHNVRYTGDTKNWTFETYTNAHTASYALLSDHGEPVPESKKVRDFMLNMDTSDGRLLAGIAAVEANETMMNDFVMASNFLANFIPRNAPVTMARQIAVIESSEGSKGARGSGKKQGGGRGPRGKGANKGQGTSGLPIHNGP